MIDIGLYNQYTKNIATALGIGYVLAVDDEQVTAQIPDSADPVLVAIIPSDDTADSLTADNMSEASTSLLFIVSPIKADTDTAEFFARHQLLTEKCKKLMMLYADAYPSLLGIKENRISSDPITGQFSGNMAGYILSFSLSNPATFYAETVPDIPGIDQPTAYIEIADVIGLLEALAGKATAEHRHATSEIDNLPEILTPLQQEVADIDARVTQAETDIAGKAPVEHRHATSDIDNLTEILDPLQQDVADIDARVTQAESEIAGKAPSMHRHATSDIDNLTEILDPLQQDVADIDARVTQAETDIAGKAPADHRHATSDIDNLTEILTPLQQDVADIDTRVTQAETGIAGKAPADHRHPTSDIDNLPQILAPLQQDVADIATRVTQAEEDINATESIVAKYPSQPVASKMLVANSEGTAYEHTAFTPDQLLRIDKINTADPGWMEQESRIPLVTKNNGLPEFTKNAELFDWQLPPGIIATLEASDAGWVNEQKTLTGDNSTFAFGQQGSSGWFTDGTFVQCVNATYTTNATVTYKRNRSVSVLKASNTRDALVINQLDPSYTYPAMTPTGVNTDTGWDLLTQTKALNNTAYPCREGTYFIGGINGSGYRYDCFLIASNTAYWKRSGLPDTIQTRITLASHPTLIGRLLAKSDWATSAYTQQAGDEASSQGQDYYDTATRSHYYKETSTIWEKLK